MLPTPSMEGRTIVRPDLRWPARLRWAKSSFNGGPDNRPARRGDLQPFNHQCCPFNGGPDNRPARPNSLTPEVRSKRLPSMEGRTIVRPDPPVPRRATSVCPTFNGGPDNRPARPQLGLDVGTWLHTLQWRAGQSSGQTLHLLPGSLHGYLPSMEGRTIVRPDSAHTSRECWRCTPLQWRAGQSSGQTSRRSDSTRSKPPPSMEGRTVHLQWRAGQSSGQTHQFLNRDRHCNVPSMEGRTIVRPDLVPFCQR